MVVTADAVKIGGGMGNIARSPQRADIYYDPSTPETGDPAVDTSEDSEDDDDSDDDENEEAIPDDEGEASIDPEQPNPVEKSAGELSKSAQVKRVGRLLHSGPPVCRVFSRGRVIGFIGPAFQKRFTLRIMVEMTIKMIIQAALYG